MKVKISRKVIAKEGVDEEGKPMEDPTLYEDTVEYEFPDGLELDDPQVAAAIAEDTTELIGKLFEVRIDAVIEDDSTLIVPDNTIQLPPGFFSRN